MTHRRFQIIIFILILGSLSGLRTEIHAQIWERANRTHRSTQITPGNGKEIFSIASRLFTSNDLGNTMVVNFPDTGITGFAIGSTGIYYFSSRKGIDTTSDPFNGNWVMLPSGDLPQVTALFVRTSADSPGEDEIWVGTAAGLWKRKLSETQWQKKHDEADGLPIMQIVGFNKNIYYRTINSAFASHDEGLTWKPISTGITNGNITSIITTSETDVYVAVSSFPSSHVLQSVDAGISFNGARGTDFGSRTVKALVANAQGDLFLGGGIRDDFKQDSITQGFIWRFLKNGSSWEDFSTGLPSTPFSEVIALGFSSAGKVFASTDSSGLWRTILPSGVRQQANQNGIILSPNFPNPVSSSTEFSVVNDHTIKASLAVFDAVGRNILQVLSGDITPGNHSFTIDTKGMPNGTYFYRLQSPEILLTKSFVVSK